MSVQTIILYNEFENYTFKITAASPRGQWVNNSDFAVEWYGASMLSYLILQGFLVLFDHAGTYNVQLKG